MRLASASAAIVCLVLMLAGQTSFAGSISQSGARHGIIIVGGSPQLKPASKSIIIVGGSPRQRASTKGIIIVGGSPQSKILRPKSHFHRGIKPIIQHRAPGM